MLDSLTLGDLKQIKNLLQNDSVNLINKYWEIDKSYFIRTVTMHLIGKLIYIDKKELVLSDASWIADSGRFHDALKNGELNEVEPFVDNVILNRDCIVDATLWNHDLPRSQK